MPRPPAKLQKNLAREVMDYVRDQAQAGEMTPGTCYSVY